MRRARPFSWDRDTSEAGARGIWFRWRNQRPGHTIVAAGPDGTVLGTAEMGPDNGGPAAHIASASFMVDPARARQGVRRAFGEHVLGLARAENYRAMQFNAVAGASTAAVALWRALGFEVLATIPDGFCHPARGYVGLHVMYRRL